MTVNPTSLETDRAEEPWDRLGADNSYYWELGDRVLGADWNCKAPTLCGQIVQSWTPRGPSLLDVDRDRAETLSVDHDY